MHSGGRLAPRTKAMKKDGRHREVGKALGIRRRQVEARGGWTLSFLAVAQDALMDWRRSW